MRAFVANLTTAMLFAHAVLGCCTHHVHACGQPHGVLAVADAAHHGSEACDSHPSHGNGGSGLPSHEQDDCEGLPCDFGPPADALDAKSFAADPQLVASLSANRTPAVVGTPQAHARDVTGVLPAVPLYLAQHVLLI